MNRSKWETRSQRQVPLLGLDDHEVPSVAVDDWSVRKCVSFSFSTAFGTGIFFALFLSSAVARGTSTLPVRITVTGDSTCAGPVEFREAVRRKGPDLVDAGVDEAAREFVVEMRVRPDGVAEGKVRISEPSGASITRRLEGNDCTEVIEALAFIVAELGRAVRLEPEGGEAAPPPPPSTVTPQHPAPKATREPPKRTEKTRLRWEVGAGLQAVSGPAPDWLPAPLAYLELGVSPDGTPPRFSGRLSALYAQSGTIQGTVGNAEIVWAVGRAELCGPRLGAALAASGCLSFDAGLLEGRGSGAASAPKTERTVWLAPGLTLRGHFVIERTLVVGLEAGAFIAQIRPRFYFTGPEGERDSIHEVPWVGFRAGLGLGVLFP